jgi:hypothetical protein
MKLPLVVLWGTLKRSMSTPSLMAAAVGELGVEVDVVVDVPSWAMKAFSTARMVAAVG